MPPDGFMFAALQAVFDSTPVEHIGGPNDGELRPIRENGLRRDGMYVVVNNPQNVVIAKRFVPND